MGWLFFTKKFTLYHHRCLYRSLVNWIAQPQFPDSCEYGFVFMVLYINIFCSSFIYFLIQVCKSKHLYINKKIIVKKFSFLILFFLFAGCDRLADYNGNSHINGKVPPVTIIAMDTISKSVLFRDGDNKVFTITDNSTTRAICKSLHVGDTIRLDYQVTSVSGNIK